MPAATQISAIPDRLKGHTEQAPPGHRFQLYLTGWRLDGKQCKLDKAPATNAVVTLGDTASKLLAAVRDRQLALAQQSGAWLQPARTTAPLITGVGIEHPTENGFAFLSPYGLPYLPGSSIKGVLRRAAEELALGPEDKDKACGWDLLALWRLFGFENASFLGGDRQSRMDAAARDLASKDPDLVAGLQKALKQEKLDAAEFLCRLTTKEGDTWRDGLQWRGALVFWDALLDPGSKMAVEILTPHHANYYVKADPPSDNEQPNPVPFLATGPGTKLTLAITCDPSRLTPDLREHEAWKTLLTAAFKHAATSVGFGAKTAVGYGALEADPDAEKKLQQLATARAAAAQAAAIVAAEQARLDSLPPLERELAELAAPVQGRIAALIKELESGRWQPPQSAEVAAIIKREMQAADRWRETPRGKNPAKDFAHQDTRRVKKFLA